MPSVEETLNVKENRAPLGEDKFLLVVLSGKQSGQLFELGEGTWVIGRDEEVDIRLNEPSVSRRHAVLTSTSKPGEFQIEDLGSRNGTRVGEQSVSSTTIVSLGDKIWIGKETALRLSAGSDIEIHFAVQMSSAALRDPLTQVYNRRYFEERFEEDLSYSLRHGRALSLLLLDIDHFKQVNDTFGHDAGDEVLRAFANALNENLRVDDQLSRFGGEEFAVLCRETTEREASELAERLRVAVSELSLIWQGEPLEVRVSIGVASLQGRAADEDSKLTLLRAADKALYEAKRRGRDRVIRHSHLVSS